MSSSSTDKLDTLLDNLHDAYFIHSFENGVKWLNERAYSEFRVKYPELVIAIEDLMDYKNQ